MKKILLTVLSLILVLTLSLGAVACGDDIEYDEEGNTFFSIQLNTKSGKPCTYSATLYKTMANGELVVDQFYGTAPDIQTTYAVQLDLVVVKNDSTDTLNVSVFKGRKEVAKGSVMAVGGNVTLIAR